MLVLFIAIPIVVGFVEMFLISNATLAFVVPMVSMVAGMLVWMMSRSACRNEATGLTAFQRWKNSHGMVACLYCVAAITTVITLVAVAVDLMPEYSVAWTSVGVTIGGLTVMIMAGGYAGALMDSTA